LRIFFLSIVRGEFVRLMENDHACIGRGVFGASLRAGAIVGEIVARNGVCWAGQTKGTVFMVTRDHALSAERTENGARITILMHQLSIAGDGCRSFHTAHFSLLSTLSTWAAAEMQPSPIDSVLNSDNLLRHSFPSREIRGQGPTHDRWSKSSIT